MPVRWLFAGMLLVGLAVAAYADVYSFTDEDGVVHFTNIRPRGGKWRKVLDSQPPKSSKAAVDRCPRCDKVGARDHSPERFHRYDAYIQEASELYRIPIPLIRAVIKVESDYDPNVVSAVDCKGLMQIHPAVEADMGIQGRVFDPRSNIMAGTRLLRWLANRLDGDLVLTIAGYHAGIGSVQKYGNTVPPYTRTRHYLQMVLARYNQYKAEEANQRAN